jgi:hypothetical protein
MTNRQFFINIMEHREKNRKHSSARNICRTLKLAERLGFFGY